MQKNKQLAYVDVATSMLDPEREVRKDIFKNDNPTYEQRRLHHLAGYIESSSHREGIRIRTED